MKTKSAKAKGRRAASEFQQMILKTFPQLHEDDVRVTPSGVKGEDLQLSPKAREIFPFAVEVKNQERLNIWDALEQSKSHVKENASKSILVFKRNKTPFHVCMEIETFIEIISA